MYKESDRSSKGSSALTKVLIVLLALVLLGGAAFFLIWYDRNYGSGKANPNTPQNSASPTQSADASAAPATVPPAVENPDGLIISEVKRGEGGFIEVFNNSDKAVDLGSYYLSDDYTKVDKWRFPQYEIAPGGYAVALLQGSGFIGDALYGENIDSGTVCPIFNATFKISSIESGAYLFTRGGYLVSSMELPADMPEPVCAIRYGTGVAYTGVPTPCKANAESAAFSDFSWHNMDQSDPIRINEVLIDNQFDLIDHDGDRPDWVELYNASASPVSLLGYYLSDSADNPSKWALPDITLGAGEYTVILLSGKDVVSDSEVHASFKLSLSDAGIFLFNYNGMRKDGIAFPEQLNPNVSIGRAEDEGILYYAKPTPGEKNTTAGFADQMGVGGFNPSSVYISEVSAVAAPRSGEMDWVELHNPTAEAISLAGWHLSDSGNDLNKHDLSALSIPAGGYIAINCTSKINKDWANPAPFSISPSGETLYLTNGEGGIVDFFETGALRYGVTSGRSAGSAGGERVFFTAATKGTRNSDASFNAYSPVPVISDTELYRTSPFTVELSVSAENAEIHYTLDGSRPTEESPVYTAPISINSNTVLRAASVASGALISEDATATYLFEQKHTLPVVTLCMDKGDFSEMYAIDSPFVPVVERECHMQFFETDGTLGLETHAGVRVSGASTRKYPQKSLGIYFRAGYGRSGVSYPFFGSDYFTKYSSITLRNAGQDWSNARIRDSFASTAVLDMNLDASAARFCVVYINGEYWGLYDLKENMNEDYLETHYGVDPDTANIIKRNTVELEGSNADFLRVRAYAVQNDTVIPMTDARYAEFTKWVDAESIMDYLIARQYLTDADMFNQKYWRTTDYAVRWRAIFYDSDFALTSAMGDVLHCYFDPKGVPSANGSLSQMDLFCGLESNEKWRHDFLVRYIYVSKYYLNNDRLIPLLESMAAEIEPELSRQIARWGHPVSMEHWRSEIEKLRTNLLERPAYCKQNIMYVMHLTEADWAALEAEADAINVANGGVFK